MSIDNSITRLILGIRDGDSLAASKLWNRYFHRLIALAREKMIDVPKGIADEEDVVLSAFDSFFRGVEGGRFPKLDDRNDLWQVLVMLTARKAANYRKSETRLKRGGGRLGMPTFDKDEDAIRSLDQIIGTEPSPEFAAMVADQYRWLLESLNDDVLRRIAVRKMEGDTNDEIARDLRVKTRTVERKLNLIRQLWSAQ